MAIPMGFWAFILKLIPELLKLFDKHQGQVEPAKRDMRSLTSEIKADEAAMDAELKRQREAGG